MDGRASYEPSYDPASSRDLLLMWPMAPESDLPALQLNGLLFPPNCEKSVRACCHIVPDRLIADEPFLEHSRQHG